MSTEKAERYNTWRIFALHRSELPFELCPSFGNFKKYDILVIRHDWNPRKLINLDFWSLLYGHKPSDPCLWLLTQVSLFPHFLHCFTCTDVLGWVFFFFSVGWLVLVGCFCVVFFFSFFFFKERLHVPRYTQKILFPVFYPYFNQSNQMYSAAPSCFPAHIKNPYTLEIILLILCHTQDFWTLAGN